MLRVSPFSCWDLAHPPLPVAGMGRTVRGHRPALALLWRRPAGGQYHMCACHRAMASCHRAMTSLEPLCSGLTHGLEKTHVQACSELRYCQAVTEVGQ